MELKCDRVNSWFITEYQYAWSEYKKREDKINFMCSCKQYRQDKTIKLLKNRLINDASLYSFFSDWAPVNFQHNGNKPVSRLLAKRK